MGPSDIGKGIQAALAPEGIDQLDLVVFNAGQMMEYSVLVDLANVTRYVIGSQEIMTRASYDYAGILANLASASNQTAKELSTLFAESYRDSSEVNFNVLSTCSVINSEGFSQVRVDIASAFDKLRTVLTNVNVPGQRNLILGVVGQARGDAWMPLDVPGLLNPQVVDFGSFWKSMEQNTALANTTATSNSVELLGLVSTLQNVQVGLEAAIETLVTSYATRQATGFSLYFPLHRASYEPEYDSLELSTPR
eukprot:scaffold1172_cov409-Prasinococcus_capsulatus_cf.AAC.5